MIKTILAKNIKRIRKEKELTQINLSIKCDIEYRYLANIEQANKNVTIEVVEKIARGLEVEIEELFKKQRTKKENSIKIKKLLLKILELL